MVKSELRVVRAAWSWQDSALHERHDLPDRPALCYRLWHKEAALRRSASRQEVYLGEAPAGSTDARQARNALVSSTTVAQDRNARDYRKRTAGRNAGINRIPR
jgi:hypothetical protein